ncbi:tight adherence protein B [Evansella caseinilytica]|uniref:Tight adherence protein B n=1 Tax=Evansella caseinilytica TaxID=1503961 RepID=A0A1H3QXW7_9BACI|nr:type II secretion system F family protein [Evansella caseinilytica]SDZ18267.1 tight adherence protein B [Evansella caseinilytica]
MEQDMLILLVIPIILIVYLITARRRKQAEKKKQFEENTPQEQSSFAKRAAEIKAEAAKKKIRQVEGHLVDYSTYKMQPKEYLFYLVIAMAVLFFLGQLFYESLIVSLLLCGLGFLFPRMQRKSLLQKRKEKLALQFKEAIASLSTSLAAGRSIENSFREVVNDLRLLYPDPNTMIIKEFEIINRRVENGETIERAVQDFATRSDSEDILNFADVFITCKRTGGNLVEVIRRTADVIGEKVDIQQEVKVMVAQKRFESRILTVLPVGMIAFLKYTSGDYLEPLYNWGYLGPVVMTFCLGLLIFSYWLSQRIMNIKV